MEALSVTVLFFAGAREAVGTRRETVGLKTGTTITELAEELVARHGEGLRAVIPSCALWVNGEPATPATALRPGDEVAVLPPVSGG